MTLPFGLELEIMTLPFGLELEIMILSFCSMVQNPGLVLKMDIMT